LRKLSPPDLFARCHFRYRARFGIAFTRGQSNEYASSPGVRRSFCGTCGSPIAYRSERHPGLVHLFAGTLTDPAHLSPSLHTHADEQLPWFEMLDDPPRYAQGSRGQTPMRYGPREARK
jgi:hypothetical protein